MPTRRAKQSVPARNRSPFGWWIASYIERFQWRSSGPIGPSSKCLAYENTILIRADSRDRAYQKAMAFGAQGSDRRWRKYGEPPGQLGRWVFEGVTSLLPIYERLSDGAEVEWLEHRNTTVGAVKKRVKDKRTLAVFRDGE